MRKNFKIFYFILFEVSGETVSVLYKEAYSLFASSFCFFAGGTAVGSVDAVGILPLDVSCEAAPSASCVFALCA